MNRGSLSFKQWLRLRPRPGTQKRRLCLKERARRPHSAHRVNDAARHAGLPKPFRQGRNRHHLNTLRPLGQMRSGLVPLPPEDTTTMTTGCQLACTTPPPFASLRGAIRHADGRDGQPRRSTRAAPHPQPAIFGSSRPLKHFGTGCQFLCSSHHALCHVSSGSPSRTWTTSRICGGYRNLDHKRWGILLTLHFRPTGR
jgi:hypothetical protein